MKQDASFHARWTQRDDDLREAYSPIGLMAAGIRSISGSIPFDKLILYGLRLIRRRFL